MRSASAEMYQTIVLFCADFLLLLRIRSVPLVLYDYPRELLCFLGVQRYQRTRAPHIPARAAPVIRCNLDDWRRKFENSLGILGGV